MSELIQLLVRSSSSGVNAPGERSDAGSEGFARLFEQQMARGESEPSPFPAGPKPVHGTTGDARPAPADASEDVRPEPSRPDREPSQDPADLVDTVHAQAAAAAGQALRQTQPQAPEPAAPKGASEPAPAEQAQEAEAPAAAAEITPEEAQQALLKGIRAAVQEAQARSQGRTSSAPLPVAEAPAPAPTGPAPQAAAERPSARPAPQARIPEADVAAELPEPAGAPPASEAAPGLLERATAETQDVPEAPPSVQLDADLLARLGLAPLANPILLGALNPSPAALPAVVAPPAGLEAAAPVLGQAPAAPRVSGPAGAAAAPEASQAEMIERLAATAKLVASAKGERSFLLRLQPPELGPVKVRLQVDGDTVNLRIVTTETGRHAILQNLEHLKQALADQGLQLGRFDVTTDGQDGAAAQFAREQQDGSGRRRTPEEELAERLLAAPGGLGQAGRDEEEPGEVPVSDAMAVNLLA